ncbi:MAG: deoxyribose-phosphate aldolase [Ilumatobacteraceae bacterium]
MDMRRAWLAVSLVDLTNLSDGCTSDEVDTLCTRALVAGTAAVCVWPDFVARATATLAGHSPSVATVVNFPTGDERAHATSLLVERALSDGADEIDVVLPYRSFAAGERARSGTVLAAVRAATEGVALMKVILETGELVDETLIGQAAAFAIDHGADFLKTSTGKSAVSATPEAVRVMLGEIQRAGRPVGLKVSGGLRTSADAEEYLTLAESVMGSSYLERSTFRLGASSLLDALLEVGDADDQSLGG